MLAMKSALAEAAASARSRASTSLCSSALRPLMSRERQITSTGWSAASSKTTVKLVSIQTKDPSLAIWRYSRVAAPPCSLRAAIISSNGARSSAWMNSLA